MNNVNCQNPQLIDWWRNAIIYQVYPRSFYDSNGDGIGDIQGIIAHLDYITALGVDAIWLCPLFESPMDDFGYDVTDMYTIDPDFGTLEDFDQLLADAHNLGLKVIIDQVWNHTSDQHPWFLESRQSRDNPKADWYVWADPQEDAIAISSDYVTGSERLHLVYNSALFFQNPFSATQMRQTLERIEHHFSSGGNCWIAGNHDYRRLKSRWTGKLF